MTCTWRGAVWIGCLVAIAAVATPQAQTKETPPNPHRAMGMMVGCQKMMADINVVDEKLDDLIAKMNAATGRQKIDQIAAVPTKLVAQQKAMHIHMTMMGHDSAPVPETPGE